VVDHRANHNVPADDVLNLLESCLSEGAFTFSPNDSGGNSAKRYPNQIITVLDSNSIVIKEQRHPQYVNLKSSNDRADGYGNLVRDVAAFNVSSRNPTTELYSVIPQGDVRKPI
jgi:hypothetical protein